MTNYSQLITDKLKLVLDDWNKKQREFPFASFYLYYKMPIDWQPTQDVCDFEVLSEKPTFLHKRVSPLRINPSLSISQNFSIYRPILSSLPILNPN